jgi:methionine-rich copper-binding protein CopC
MKYVALCAAALIAALALISNASAHAELVSSSPGAGSTVTEAPASVVLTFDEAIQRAPGTYSLSVTDSSGASVTSGTPSISEDGTQLSIALQGGLEHGAYTVSYTNVASADGDADDGTFTFSIGDEPVAGEMPAGHADEADHHDEEGGHEAAATHDEDGAPTTGLIVVHLSEQHGSGVDGRAELLPADGGRRTQIGVYVNGIVAGSSHATHIHVQDTCAAAPGAHAADLEDIESDGVPHGSSVTTVDVPFTTIANGGHAVMVHAGPSGGDKAVIACGEIPRAPRAPVSLPQTGEGSTDPSGGLPWLSLVAMLILVGGSIVLTGGATLRRQHQ